MSTYSFKLPDLGEGTVESEIVEWRVAVGDHIELDQPLVDMMTDKATVEITSPVSGEVVSLAGEPGEIIAVGSELVVFKTESNETTSSDAGTKNRTTEKTEPVPAPEQIPEKPAQVDKPLTSPSIRRIAREHNIDLSQIPGTGPKGRITRKDLEGYIDNRGGRSKGEKVSKQTATREIKVIGLRRKIAEQMTLSYSRIPHFTYVEEVDVTELERLRQHMNDSRNEAQPKLSYLPFFMRALVKVLREFPQCNARFDDENNVVTEFDAVHIGIATQTDSGLTVPVVKHVETLDLWECANALKDVAEKTRQGRAGKDDLTGSTISISSLGALGGIATTPVINYPEVAIIGVNKTREQPKVENGILTTRLVMNLSSSFDHRVVDGYDAARMIQALKAMLEHPATIFI